MDLRLHRETRIADFIIRVVLITVAGGVTYPLCVLHIAPSSSSAESAYNPFDSKDIFQVRLLRWVLSKQWQSPIESRSIWQLWQHVPQDNRRRTIGHINFRMVGKGGWSVYGSWILWQSCMCQIAKSCSAYKGTPPNGNTNRSNHPCHSCPVLAGSVLASPVLSPLRRTNGTHMQWSHFAKH